MKVLTKTEFGNSILRKKARKLTRAEIDSAKIQNLIKDMRYTLRRKKMGVGLAAPQVGKSIALAIVSIHPTPHRPVVTPFDLVIINPKITSKINKKPWWEGCVSAGKESMFAKVPRYNKITLEYLDETGKVHKRQFTGLPAQVIQHEVDHLSGVLFVERVEDPKTYISMSEYKKLMGVDRKSPNVP